MKQEDIQIGGTYLVGLAGNLVPVLITEDHTSGTGWLGKTIKTGKQITIRSAQRIHQAVESDKDASAAKQGKRKPKATANTTNASKRDTGTPRKSAATGGDQVTTGKPMSLINAAAHILAQDDQEPLRCKDIVEKAITAPRHVEVQVLGDGRQVRHLWERECSLQRRQQKILEVAPAPDLDPELRQALLQAALTLSRGCGFLGLGTFEFLIFPGPDQPRFVFMEANPRIQVEHTVTEGSWGWIWLPWGAISCFPSPFPKVLLIRISRSTTSSY